MRLWANKPIRSHELSQDYLLIKWITHDDLEIYGEMPPDISQLIPSFSQHVKFKWPQEVDTIKHEYYFTDLFPIIISNWCEKKNITICTYGAAHMMRNMDSWEVSKNLKLQQLSIMFSYITNTYTHKHTQKHFLEASDQKLCDNGHHLFDKD